MPSRKQGSILGALLLATGLAGCENVVWGGADIEIVPPPPQLAQEIEPDAQAFGEYGLPSGPLLFHLIEGEQGSQLVPVAELSTNGIRAVRRPSGVAADAYATRFRDTVLPIGAQFDVFRRGARVGTFVAQANGELTACGVPTVTGNTTVVAAAVGEDNYLAFRRGLAPAARGEFTPPQVTGPIRTYASIVAERLILQAGLPRPRSWPGAQRDLQPIEILEGGHPEMAATYLVGDNLEVGTPQPEGYSVFYVADYATDRGYTSIYSEVRDYRRTGKAAPELIDYVDWDEDGSPELMLHVFGRDGSWYEIIGNTGESWEKVYQGQPCQPGSQPTVSIPSTSSPAAAPADTTGRAGTAATDSSSTQQ